MFIEDQSSVEVRAPLPWRAPVAALRCKSRPRKQSKSGKFCDLIDVARSHNHLAIAQKQSRTIIITSLRSYRNHLGALHPDMPLATASSALSKFHIHMITHETSHKNHAGEWARNHFTSETQTTASMLPSVNLHWCRCSFRIRVRWRWGRIKIFITSVAAVTFTSTCCSVALQIDA
jgi:hypothetical protein